jgi:hypothetical protein
VADLVRVDAGDLVRDGGERDVDARDADDCWPATS